MDTMRSNERKIEIAYIHSILFQVLPKHSTFKNLTQQRISVRVRTSFHNQRTACHSSLNNRKCVSVYCWDLVGLVSKCLITREIVWEWASELRNNWPFFGKFSPTNHNFDILVTITQTYFLAWIVHDRSIYHVQSNSPLTWRIILAPASRRINSSHWLCGIAII